jgi:putative heme transporter
MTIHQDQLQEPSTAFTPPRWLQDLGRSAWLVVGAVALLVGLVWLLGTTSTIVGPVVLATIIATVAMPLVAALDRHMPRAAAAAIVLVGLVGLALLVVFLVIGGITSQTQELSKQATSAADKAQSWLEGVGMSTSSAAGAKSAVEADVPKILSTLTTGVIHGIKGLTSLAFGLSLTALSLFFLLKDGTSFHLWVDRHLGVPPRVAQSITAGIIKALRGYFRGVTIVAAFNGVVVGVGALLLGVPLAGTIAAVTFVTAYIPFIGAFVAGALAVVVALGANGAATAAIMLLIVLLANGLLQNILQPFAMGSALDLNPLVVLVATISAGCIFGTLGLVLAAPLLSAAVHIIAELREPQLLPPLDSPDTVGAARPEAREPTAAT